VLSIIKPAQEGTPYNAAMPRRLSKPRPPQGARLLELRKAAGLSQEELARLLGESQRNIAFWEQSDRPPRSDLLPKLAKVLGVRIEDLLNTEGPIPARRGPPGRLQLIFEEVARLPRGEREKIIEFLSALVDRYKRRAG
jgi:transcriptional regulator with XRE-family HTH domain